jgi:RND family efflux transporter MFP subunit
MPPQQFGGPTKGGTGTPSQQFNVPMPGMTPQQFNGPVPVGSGAPPQQFNGPMPVGPGMPPQQFSRPPMMNNRMTDTPPPSPMVNGSGVHPAGTYGYRPPSTTVSVFGRQYSRMVVILLAACIAAVIFAGFFLAYRYLKTPSVALYQAKAQDVNRSVGGSGIIYPQTQLVISFPLVERVTTVNVKPGDVVKPNQQLVQLDLTQLDAEVKQASDNVAAAQTYLNSVAGSVQAPAAQSQLDRANASYNSLIAQRNSPTLQNGALVSPLQGVVTQVNVNPGEVAAANAPLVTLQVQSTVIARVQIPLAYVNQVYPNQAAVVTPSALPNLNLDGKVVSVIPQASQNADTFEVWISLPNDKKELLPGMSTFARLQEPLHAIVIPRLAVLNPDQNSAVFVVRDGHAYEKQVQIGGYVGNNVIIEGGIADGDTVAVTGVDGLQNGQAVKVISVEQPH